MGVEIQVGGSWKEAADRTPIGVISAFGGTVAPDGWLICDGAAVSRTTYAELYAVIGTNFGAGDGANTFNLPDLRGRFLRGTASGQATDPDRAARSAMASGGNAGDAVGSVQADAIQGHYHNAAAGSFLNSSGGSSAPTSVTSGWSAQAKTGAPSTDGTNGTPRTSSETRPVNAGVNFIIKS